MYSGKVLFCGSILCIQVSLFLNVFGRGSALRVSLVYSGEAMFCTGRGFVLTDFFFDLMGIVLDLIFLFT